MCWMQLAPVQHSGSEEVVAFDRLQLQVTQLPNTLLDVMVRFFWV